MKITVAAIVICLVLANCKAKPKGTNKWFQVGGYIMNKAGNPLAGAEVRIINPDGQDVSTGDWGPDCYFEVSTDGFYIILSSEEVTPKFAIRIICDTTKPDKYIDFDLRSAQVKNGEYNIVTNCPTK